LWLSFWPGLFGLRDLSLLASMQEEGRRRPLQGNDLVGFAQTTPQMS
jgi:hypothetical protein